MVPMYAKNDDHDAYFYHWWNDKKRNTSTSKPVPADYYSTTTAYAPIQIPIKDDPFVTPTFETLCTLDTYSSQLLLMPSYT